MRVGENLKCRKLNTQNTSPGGAASLWLENENGFQLSSEQRIVSGEPAFGEAAVAPQGGGQPVRNNLAPPAAGSRLFCRRNRIFETERIEVRSCNIG